MSLILSLEHVHCILTMVPKASPQNVYNKDVHQFKKVLQIQCRLCHERPGENKFGIYRFRPKSIHFERLGCSEKTEVMGPILNWSSIIRLPFLIFKYHMLNWSLSKSEKNCLASFQVVGTMQWAEALSSLTLQRTWPRRVQYEKILNKERYIILFIQFTNTSKLRKPLFSQLNTSITKILWKQQWEADSTP